MNWAPFSPLLQVGVLTLGSTVCSLVAYFGGHVSAYLPFISETGALVPEICIFSYTLILGSFFGVVTVCFRFLTVSCLLSAEEIKLRRLNSLGLASGIVSMAGLAGVAAFPMSTVLWGHLGAAGCHFVTGVGYLFVQTLLTFQLPPPHRNAALGTFRLVLSVLTLTFMVLLGICFPIGYVQWKESNDKPHAMKTPQDKAFGILLASSVFEWMFQVTFLTFFSSMFTEFRKFELTIGAKERSKPEPDLPVTAEKS